MSYRTIDEIEERLRKTVAEFTGAPIENVVDSALLRKDLELNPTKDSSEIPEFWEQIEDDLEIMISDEIRIPHGEMTNTTYRDLKAVVLPIATRHWRVAVAA